MLHIVGFVKKQHRSDDAPEYISMHSPATLHHQVPPSDVCISKKHKSVHSVPMLCFLLY